MSTVALLLIIFILVCGGLVFHAIRTGREVEALIALGRAIFKLKVK